jgi:hydroxymethylbilane synthase
MPQQLRIGSRPSRLALAQSQLVKTALERIAPGLVCEIVPIRTTGDKLTTPSLAGVGGKGLFVRELEQALAAGQIDLAVHSMKDMPARLDRRFRLIAVPAREATADVLLTGGPDLSGLAPGARLGTASLRRRFQAARIRPDLDIQPLRGNIDTRLKRLREGEFDAIILAAAGLHRLGQSDLPPSYRLNVDDFVPAGGQGALAVEARTGVPAGGSEEIERAIAAMDDRRTRIEISAERALLAEIGASCASPIGVKATAHDRQFSLNAMLFSLDGAHLMADALRCALPSDIAEAEHRGIELAQRMVSHGAAELIGNGT